MSVGITHDTAEFAAATTRRWGEDTGRSRFPQATELLITAALDPNDYPSGKKGSDKELSQVQLKPHKFHGEWSYTINPRTN